MDQYRALRGVVEQAEDRVRDEARGRLGAARQQELEEP